MIDRLFSNPVVAFGFIIAVVYLFMFYIAQRERSQVSQMRGRNRRFRPNWKSGRKHHRRSARRSGEGFKPDWSRKRQSQEPKAGDSSGAAGTSEAPGAIEPPGEANRD